MDIWIAVVIALGFTFFAFWQKRTWVFYIAGICWIVMGIFNFTDYTKADIGWYFAFIYLAIGLVCITAGVWLKERKGPDEDERDVRFRERQEKIDKKKNGF